MKKIISLKIGNSTFYENGIQFAFSEKLNCIMGGRGTGKSTLLHFLKATIDPEGDNNRNTYNVLKSNLGNGIITIELQDNEGKKFRLEKSLDEEVIVTQISNGRNLPINNVYENLVCDIYEAQAIEDIGKNSYERLELLDKMILKERASFQSEIERIQISLDENAQQIKAENQRIHKLESSLSKYEQADAELKKLLDEDKPADLDEKERVQFEDADKNEKIRKAEKRFSNTIIERLNGYRELVRELDEMVEDDYKNRTNVEIYTNKKELNSIVSEFKTILDKIKYFVNEYEKAHTTGFAIIKSSQDKLDEVHHSHQTLFIKLRQKFDQHKSFYNKWNSLTTQLDEQKAITKSITDLKTKYSKLKASRKKMIDAFNKQKKGLFDLRKQKVDELNSLFKGAIKITLTFGGLVDEFEQALRDGLKGSNMRYNTLIPAIVENFTPDRFADVIHNKDASKLKNISGIDEQRSQAIIDALFETEKIYEIEMIHCADLPEFLLKIDAHEQPYSKKEDYKKSDELSTGQRCTTVLPIIFAVSSNPLIIDQPEDNLDNKYISETIHKIIREQKSERQLIFITHNPNIPVLADAEQNYFLRYSEKKSVLDAQGNIESVKDNILGLLEGGKEAFSKRDKLYGINNG